MPTDQGPSGPGAFQQLADLLPEPMLVARSDGTIHACNPAFRSLFGWRNEELAGASVFGLVASPREEVAELLRHCAATSGFLLGGMTLRHRDGTESHCRVEGAALRSGRAPDERLVVLRLSRKESAAARFVQLTQQLGDLNAEVVRRRRAEGAAADALERERRLRGRLASLAEASGALVASLALKDVLPAIGELAVRLIPADGHAVWFRSRETLEWRADWSRGLSDGFVSIVAEGTGSTSAARLPAPLFVENVDEAPLLANRRQVYAAEGIRSLIVIPLQVEGVTRGTVVAYYRRPVEITDDDRRVSIALGNLSSSALATTTLYEAESRSRLAAQMAASRAAFLARASSVLASSLDYEATLKTVAQLAVPEIADWCAVDMVTEHGDLKRLAVAHADPSKIQLAQDLQERYPQDPGAPHGPAHALRSRKPVMLSGISDDLLVASARDAGHLALMRALELTAYMSVPLVARGRPLGVLTFVSAESGRGYTDADLHFAEDLAARAGLAIENALAYQEVRRTNRVKDEFLATLSHELRTPLNAVLGYARMIRSGALEPGTEQRALEVLERNALSLTQIVEDILDVSRIVAGKIRLNVQPLDLSAVLREAADTVRPAAEARGVALALLAPPAAPYINGDPDRLQQVLWNLLSNAVKFTPRGGRVDASIDTIGSQIEVVVRDTGIGIGAGFLPHLFEPFRQSDSGFSREHGGLGLGLSIARHIVEMHGGQISATSDGEGRGATFRVRLPVLAARPAGRNRPEPTTDGAPRSAEPQRLAGQLAGVRVLVVDDDADARMLLSDILQSAGAQVTTAGSAAAALRRLEDDAVPDVLLTDVGMPGMDGLEMMALIRRASQPSIRKVPAIALTAYARSEDRVRSLDSGCQKHVAKPISPGELVAAIRSLVRGSSTVR